MIQKKGDFKLPELRRQLSTFRRIMPVIVAEEARNHFDDGFRQGGGKTDASRSGWRPRKPPRSKRQAKRDRGRAILVLNSYLRNDIQARRVSYNAGILINTVSIPYAYAHNRGVKPQPQREFIGKSTELEAKNRRTIDREIQRALSKAQIK